jgi:hypothetical protein
MSTNMEKLLDEALGMDRVQFTCALEGRVLNGYRSRALYPNDGLTIPQPILEWGPQLSSCDVRFFLHVETQHSASPTDDELFEEENSRRPLHCIVALPHAQISEVAECVGTGPPYRRMSEVKEALTSILGIARFEIVLASKSKLTSKFDMVPSVQQAVDIAHHIYRISPMGAIDMASIELRLSERGISRAVIEEGVAKFIRRTASFKFYFH